LRALKRAKTDIKSGELAYCYNTGSLLHISLRSSHELDSLLELSGLQYTEEMTSDLIYPDQTQGCYCDYMNEMIAIKYGNEFIDSLLNLSDSLHVRNNLTDTFYYANCDTWPNYPGDSDTYQNEFSKVFQEDLEKVLKYPIGYVKRPNDDLSAFVNLDLYVDKHGNADITGYSFLFDIEYNHKFEDYFKEVISKAMKKTGWTPARIRNQMVNSNLVMRLYFD